MFTIFVDDEPFDRFLDNLILELPSKEVIQTLKYITKPKTFTKEEPSLIFNSPTTLDFRLDQHQKKEHNISTIETTSKQSKQNENPVDLDKGIIGKFMHKILTEKSEDGIYEAFEASVRTSKSYHSSQIMNAHICDVFREEFDLFIQRISENSDISRKIGEVIAFNDSLGILQDVLNCIYVDQLNEIDVLSFLLELIDCKEKKNFDALTGVLSFIDKCTCSDDAQSYKLFVDSLLCIFPFEQIIFALRDFFKRKCKNMAQMEPVQKYRAAVKFADKMERLFIKITDNDEHSRIFANAAVIAVLEDIPQSDLVLIVRYVFSHYDKAQIEQLSQYFDNEFFPSLQQVYKNSVTAFTLKTSDDSLKSIFDLSDFIDTLDGESSKLTIDGYKIGMYKQGNHLNYRLINHIDSLIRNENDYEDDYDRVFSLSRKLSAMDDFIGLYSRSFISRCIYGFHISPEEHSFIERIVHFCDNEKAKALSSIVDDFLYGNEIIMERANEFSIAYFSLINKIHVSPYVFEDIEVPQNVKDDFQLFRSIFSSRPENKNKVVVHSPMIDTLELTANNHTVTCNAYHLHILNLLLTKSELPKTQFAKKALSDLRALRLVTEANEVKNPENDILVPPIIDFAPKECEEDTKVREREWQQRALKSAIVSRVKKESDKINDTSLFNDISSSFDFHVDRSAFDALISELIHQGQIGRNADKQLTFNV